MSRSLRARLGGFSLLEAVVSFLVLSLLTTILFGVFQMGSRTFQTLALRQGIQSETRRINNLLRRDLVSTHFRSIAIVDRTATTGEERDCLTFAGLDNWSDPNNFDSNQKPRWDVYVMWYATFNDSEKGNPQMTDKPELGQLIRKEVWISGGALVYPLPMSSPQTFLNTPGGIGVARYQILSRGVETFSVNTSDIGNELVQAHLVLRQPIPSVNPTSGDRVFERFECYIDMHPENTWPSY